MIKKILTTLFATAFITSSIAFHNEGEGNDKKCMTLQDCNFPNGICVDNVCVCTTCYETEDGDSEACTRTLIPATVALLLTMSFGLCGIDHCLLSGCTCPGVCFGIIKGLTAGGFLIWYFVDVIFMINGEFNERYEEVVDYREICDL